MSSHDFFEHFSSSALFLLFPEPPRRILVLQQPTGPRGSGPFSLSSVVHVKFYNLPCLRSLFCPVHLLEGPPLSFPRWTVPRHEEQLPIGAWACGV